MSSKVYTVRRENPNVLTNKLLNNYVQVFSAHSVGNLNTEGTNSLLRNKPQFVNCHVIK